MIDKSKLKELVAGDSPLQIDAHLGFTAINVRIILRELLDELESARNATLEEAAKAIDALGDANFEGEKLEAAIECISAIRALATTASTEPTDQAHVMSPFAAPADQLDSARLDFVLDRQAFITTIPANASFGESYQLIEQDEDEDYHVISGDGIAYRTKREAIDAARTDAASRGAAQGRITSDNGASPAADVGGLTRYEPVDVGVMCKISADEIGLNPASEYVKYADVCALLATKAAQPARARRDISFLCSLLPAAFCWNDSLSASKLCEILDKYDSAFASPAPSAKQEPSDPTLAYESALEGFISVLGIEESGSVRDDSKAALDKLNGILAAPSASASPAAPQQGCSWLVGNCQCTPLIQERDELRAEVDRLRTPVSAPVAGSQQVSAQFTEKQIAAAARFMSDSSAAVCCVDKDDNWKLYGDSFAAEFKGALAAALAAAPAVPVPAEHGWKPTPEQAEEWAARNGVRGLNPRALALAIEDAATLHLVEAAPSLQQGKEGAGDD